jgi:hypothetical protein
MAPYDYGSVMHYGPTSFAINSNIPTITPSQNSSAFIGQRVRLSPIDILEIQRYYGCVETPTSTTTTATTATTTTATTSRTTTATTTATTGTANANRNSGVHHVLSFYSLILIIMISMIANYLK